MKEEGCLQTKEFDLRNCDCMDLMKEFNDNHFDLAIVDPPYGIEVNVNIGRRKASKKSNYHKFAGGDKSIPKESFYTHLFNKSSEQIIWGGNYMTDYLYPSPCWLLWDKGFSEGVTFAQYEMAWTSFKSSAKKFNYNAARNSGRIHPTQKPVKLYEWLLLNYAKPNDKILDTHLGSMSIAIAVHNVNEREGWNLHLTGSELDKEYYDQGIKRVKSHCAQKTIFS